MTTSNQRLNEVLKCIVEVYTDSVVPVGSRAVSKLYGARLSPASIRNVMADLEEMGMIRQPHTSAGRVPTQKGYRYYVDHLMSQEHEGESEIPSLAQALEGVRNIEHVAERISRLLANLSGNAAVTVLKNVRRVSYIGSDTEHAYDEVNRGQDRLYVDGTRYILGQPEFRDLERITRLVEAFENKDQILAFLERGDQESKVRIHIGQELDCFELDDVSMVAKEYALEDTPIGCVGVIGPSRMHYDRTVKIVNDVADAMTEYLREM